MSLERLDTTPERMAAMSGHASRAASGTRSNSDAFPAASGARPRAGAFTSLGAFPATGVSFMIVPFVRGVTGVTEGRG